MKTRRALKAVWLLMCIMISAGQAQDQEGIGVTTSGTMQWQGERIAYINGEMVRVGEAINGFEVLRIDDNGARVQEVSSGSVYYLPIDQPAQLLEKKASAPQNKAEELKQLVTEKFEPKASEKRTSRNEVQETQSSTKKGSMLPVILSMVLMGVGILTSAFGNIWFLVEAFKENVWWGLGCLFLPVVSWVFLFMHWDVAAKPFGLSLLGTLLALGAVFASPQTFSSFM